MSHLCTSELSRIYIQVILFTTFILLSEGGVCVCVCVCVCVFSCVLLIATPWAVAHQAPLSMGFSRWKYWSRLPFPAPGDLPDSGIEPLPPGSLALAGEFFTTMPPGKPRWRWTKRLLRQLKDLGYEMLLSFDHSVVSNSLWPHGLQHARLPCPFTISQSLLKLMSIELVMLSNHLMLCHPLLLLPSVFPSIRVFSNESALHIRWPKNWSFSFSISPPNKYSGLISFGIDWFDLLGILKSLLQHHSSKASILQLSAFFMIKLSHSYMTTRKTITLTRWTFVGKVMSLLFNMLPRFVIAFLPRSKCHLISWYLLISSPTYLQSKSKAWKNTQIRLIKILKWFRCGIYYYEWILYIKNIRISYSTPVCQHTGPCLKACNTQKPLRYSEWQNFGWHIRCQHIYCPIWCKQLYSGPWDGNTKIHLFLALLLYLYKCLSTAYCVPGTLLGIQLRILFFVSCWSFPFSPHKSQWYHC